MIQFSKLNYKPLIIYILFTTLFTLYGLYSYPFYDNCSLYTQNQNHFMGIFTSIFLHTGWRHYSGNIMSILFQGLVLYTFFPKKATFVLFVGPFIANFLVWFLVSPVIITGASTTAFVLKGYLITRLFFKPSLKNIIISLFFMYLMHDWNTLKIMLPMDEGRVSWQSHLIGFFVGVLLNLPQVSSLIKRFNKGLMI